MGTATNITFLIIALILFIITGWFVTKAWWDIEVIPGNEKLSTAHKYLTWGMVLCWLAVIIVVIILLAGGLTGNLSGVQIPESFDEAAKLAQKVSGGKHMVKSGVDVPILIALAIVGLLTLATGFFSAMAAILINRSGDYGANKSAYGDAVIASVAGIGGSLLLFIGYIILVIRKHNKQKALEESAKAVDEIKDISETKSVKAE